MNDTANVFAMSVEELETKSSEIEVSLAAIKAQFYAPDANCSGPRYAVLLERYHALKVERQEIVDELRSR